MKIPHYILAGGKSRRFGSDKALAEIGGRPLVVRIAEALAPATSSVTVVADTQHKYANLELRTLGDAVPNLGPLGGLSTALSDAGTAAWLLLTGCDLVAGRPGWVELLLAGRADAERPVAFRDLQGWQPLFAIYPQSVKGLVARRLADAADVSLRALLDDAEAVALDPPSVWPSPFTVNTRDDLAMARSWAAQWDQ